MTVPATKSSYDTLLIQRLRNNDLASPLKLTTGELDDVLDAALEWYSRDRPLMVVQTETGDGTKFEYSMAADFNKWIENVSNLMEVRLTSTDTTERSEDIIPEGDYEVRLNSSGAAQLRLLTRTPSTQEVIEVVFSVPHTLAGTTTIFLNERFAFLDLATALACIEVATNALQIEDSNVDADSIDLESLSDRWDSRAERWLRRYNLHIKSVEGEPIRPAGATVPLYSDSQLTGRRRLTHQLYKRAQRSRY